MKELEIANWLNEGSKSKANTNQVGGRTRTYTGTALADSDHGRVVVDMGGDSVTAEGEQGVEIPCGPQVKRGDRVLITTVNGSPYVSSVDGWGDYVGDQAAYASLYVGELDARHITAQRIDAATAYIGELEAGEITAEKITATTGFFDDLTADNITAQTIIADSATIGDLAADHVTTSQLEAATARIGDLEADHVSTTDLTAVNASISSLQSDKADISYLTSNYIDANTIDSTYATITNLNAANGKIANLESSKADITYLESNYIDADTIAAGYAAIDLANVNNAWIDHGVIRDASISSAQIIGVSANKLTAGTINGSVINVTNLNADNITAGTLNGQRLGQGTIDLDKLSADVYTEDEVDAIVSGLDARIDAQIETWTADAVPTLNNYPASSWNTNDLKAEHVGDICYVINAASEMDGYTYRFAYDNTNHAYSWILIKDNQVTAALGRLLTAEGKIEGLESFESSTSTWITQTDSGIETLRNRTSTLETDFGTFQTETFADLVDEVDEQSSTITTLSETVSTKADGSTVTEISNTVNSVSQTASENSSKISSLITTIGANSDGTNPGSSSIIARTTAVEQDLSGFHTDVSTNYASKTSVTAAQNDATAALNRQTAYSATSSTAAGTAAKVASCTNFPTLTAGTTVTVRFSTANTSSGAVTLNVNSTGAKTIYVNGSATSSSNQLLWGTNANITFVYDGTYWRVVSEPRTWYGTCSVAAGTAAKTSTINEVVICKGTTLTLNMTYENTSTSATLNVTSTGAKNIYYGTTSTRPTKSNGYSWGDGSTASFIFDGAYWRIGDTTAMSRLTATEEVVSQHSTSISQTSEALASKANASDVYTKTDVNGLISTEVSNRNSAIEQSANNITASVSSTYATKTSVEGVQDDVTALEERMESAEASIEVNAGNISSKVSQTEFRSLRVGGRNLLRSTGDPVANTTAAWPTSETASVGLTDWRSYASVGVSTLEETTGGIKITHGSSTTMDGFVIPLVYDDAVVGGEEYVLSFEYRSNVANFDNAYIITSTKTNNVQVAASTVVASETDWVKYSRVITWPSTSGKIMRALLPVYFNGDGKWVEIKDGTMKLERGNKSTNWTPAPEDVSSSISDAEKRMTTMASGIGELATGAAAAASSAQESADNAQKSADAAQDSADALDDQINGEDGLADKLSEQIEQMGVVSELVSEIDQRADRITAILEETNAVTGTVTKWMTFGSDDDDDPALEIGSSNSQMKSRFTNKKLQFVHEDHDILLELDGETSTVKAMNIETSGQIQIGKYAWVPNGTGISLLYVG